MAKDLSIIIVNFNTKDLTQGCIRSIKNSTHLTSYEIIVVDNASSDGSSKILPAEFRDIKLIANKENVGFPKANNQGVGIAGGDLILLLNSDTVVHDSSLDKCAAFMRSDESVGILGCKVLNSDGSLQPSCFREPTILSELVYFTPAAFFHYIDPITRKKWLQYQGLPESGSVDFIAGNFLLTRKAVFEKVGLLDERFFMYYEDAEFCKRVRSMSQYKIYYFADASITHYGAKSEAPQDTDKIILAFNSMRTYFGITRGALYRAAFTATCKTIMLIGLPTLGLFSFDVRFRKKIAIFAKLILS
jgi:hypothetical protein